MGDANMNGALDLTETWTYSATYSLTQDDINAGATYNLATAIGEGPDGTPTTDDSEDPTPIDVMDPRYDPSCPDCTVTPIGQNPELNITKEGLFNDENMDTYGQVGETVAYTFTVTNTGNVPLTNVSVSDPLLDRPNLVVAIVGPMGDANMTGALD